MSRLVLAEAISDDRLDEVRLALGLQLVNVLPRSPTAPAQLQFLSRDRRSLVAFVADAQLDVAYLAVGAPSPSALAEVLTELRAALPTLDEAAIDASLASASPAELGRGLAAAALSLGETPKRAASFVAALRHPAREVRSRAIVAAAYAGWPALRAPLAEVARGDDDPAVRALATHALAAFPREQSAS